MRFRLAPLAGRKLDGSLAFPGDQCWGEADADGDAEGDDTGEALGDGDGELEGELDGEGLLSGAAAGCSAGAAVVGSGGAGGVASEIRNIKTRTTTARAAGMASRCTPFSGQPPVLCAERL